MMKHQQTDNAKPRACYLQRAKRLWLTLTQVHQLLKKPKQIPRAQAHRNEETRPAWLVMTLTALARPVENCCLAQTRAGTEDESATSILVLSCTHTQNGEKSKRKC